MTDEKLVPVTVKLPESIVHRLDALVDGVTYTNRTHVVKVAIAEFLRKAEWAAPRVPAGKAKQDEEGA